MGKENVVYTHTVEYFSAIKKKRSGLPANPRLITSLKEDKDLEELTYKNDLTTSFLCSSSLGGRPQPFFLGVHFCLASILTKQTISLCSPTHSYALPLIINAVPEFSIYASMINALFTTGKYPGKNSFLQLALAGLVLIQALIQVQFLGRE